MWKCECYFHMYYHLNIITDQVHPLMAKVLPMVRQPRPPPPDHKYLSGMAKGQLQCFVLAYKLPRSQSILDFMGYDGVVDGTDAPPPYPTRPKRCIGNVLVPGTPGQPQRSPVHVLPRWNCFVGMSWVNKIFGSWFWYFYHATLV